MMTRAEFDTCLDDLDLTQSELGRLLGVNARTVRRWAENPEEMPGPAEQAVRAWQRLKRFGLSWRPDSVPLGDEDGLTVMIDSYRKQDIDISAVLEKVAARGGPNTPWQVDLDAGEARLGLMTVYFYETAAGGFAPNSYRRMDGRDLDTERDCQLLEDAYVCIADALEERDGRRKSK
jgi:hypothetical protein